MITATLLPFQAQFHHEAFSEKVQMLEKQSKQYTLDTLGMNKQYITTFFEL